MTAFPQTLRRRIVCGGAAVLLLCPSIVLGWGSEGHETVGWLAERQIAGTRAALEVKKLLRAGETLAVISTWADRIKRAGFDQESNDFLLRNPAHLTYHYTDIPFQAAEYRASLVGARPDDLIHLYARCIEILRGKSDAQDNPTGITPRVALMLIVHFAGDIEQPFHVGGGYIADGDGAPRFIDPRGMRPGSYRSDIGGNALMFGPGNVHFFWDILAVKRAMTVDAGTNNASDFAGWIAARQPPQGAWNAHGDPMTWPAQWATSILPLCRQARSGLRLGQRVEVPNPRPPPPFRSEWTIELPLGYERRAVDSVSPQLARGGYRLARLLQAIWPDSR